MSIEMISSRHRPHWTPWLIAAFGFFLYLLAPVGSQRLGQNSGNSTSQKSLMDELSKVKDENIKRVLLELSTAQTPSQTMETLARLVQLVGPLFFNNFESRKDQIVVQGHVGKDASQFPQRLLSAVTDIQGEEVKALLLGKNLDNLHAADFGFLPLAIHYALQESVLETLSGIKLSSVVKVNPGDTTLAFKATAALNNRTDQQVEFLQSIGGKIFPEVEQIIIRQVLVWWGSPNEWKDRELSLLTGAGDPLLAYLPPSRLATLDDELADRFTSTLGQAADIGKVWWLKPMSLKKSWFAVAKGARYFGGVHEWSFRRMQKLSFLLEGASPEDLKLIPPIPEIKGLVIGNHYTELQARVVFDAFYQNNGLGQEDLQEFQFHVLNLTPTQLQRFDIANSFGTLDEMMGILERESRLNYPNVLQISYYMWPLVNNSQGLVVAPVRLWQKRELSQMGKLVFLLPKSMMFQIQPDLINWDSNILQSLRSSHLTPFQVWHLTATIITPIDDRFKPDYVFMIPPPFQKGIPAHNISQILLGTPLVRPEVLRALIEESTGMLSSQQAVIIQRIRTRLSESTIIRNIMSSTSPGELFSFISPRQLTKSIGAIVKTIMEMPETGRTGLTSIITKLLPPNVLATWLNFVRESINGVVSAEDRFTAEDLLGRSTLGASNELNLAILGLRCKDLKMIDPLDVIPVLMQYRNELTTLKQFQPDRSYPLNLKICALRRIVDYLKMKQDLTDSDVSGNLLNGLNAGEIAGIGGEIISGIPIDALANVKISTRRLLLEEIGSLDMMTLFSFSTLKNLEWYGNTLLGDIQNTSLAPADATLQLPLDREALLSMGNLLCYTSQLEIVGNRSKNALPDVLEGKESLGAKTCCLTNAMRTKWFNLLTSAYGTDTSTWNQYQLAAIGDLLYTLPDADLQKISTDSLADAVSTIISQTGFHVKVMMPGEADPISFMNACASALGSEGVEFTQTVKAYSKRIYQAAQWMVNTVKTPNDLVNEVQKSSRVARSVGGRARHYRQVPLTLTPSGTYSYQSAPNQFQQSQFQSSDSAFATAGANANPSSNSAFAFSNAQNQQQFPTQQFPAQQFPTQQFPAQQFQSNDQSFGVRSAPTPDAGLTQSDFGFPSKDPNIQKSSQPQPMKVPSSAQQPSGSTSPSPAVPSVSQFNQQQPVMQPSSSTGQQSASSSSQTTDQFAPRSLPVPPVGIPNPVLAAGILKGDKLGIDLTSKFSSPGYMQDSFTTTKEQKLVELKKFQAPIISSQLGGSGRQGQFDSQQPQFQLDFSNTPSQNQMNSQFPSSQQTPQASDFGNFNQQQFNNPTVQQNFAPRDLESLKALKTQKFEKFQPVQQFDPYYNSQLGSNQQFGSLSGQNNQVGSNFNMQSNQFGFQPDTSNMQGGQFNSGSQQFGSGSPQFNSGNQQFNSGNPSGNQQQFGTNFQQNDPQFSQFSPQQSNQFGSQSGSSNMQSGQFNNGNPQFSSGSGQFSGNPQFNSGSPQQFGPNFQQNDPQFSQFNPQQSNQFGNSNMQSGQFNNGNPQFNPGSSQQFPSNNFQQNDPQSGQFNQQQQFLPRDIQSQRQSQMTPGQGFNQQSMNNFPQQQQGNFQLPGTVQPGSFPGSPLITPGQIIDISQISNATTPTSQVADSLVIRSLNSGLPSSGVQNDLNCHGIKAAGPAAIGLTMEDLGKMSQDDLFDCIEPLGELDWSEDAKFGILKLVKEKLPNPPTSQLNAITLIELGKLVSALSFKSEATAGSDISSMDLTLPPSYDVLSILGTKVQDPDMLKALAEKFNADNRIFPGFAQGIARPDNLRIAVISLGNIICGFSDKIVNSIFESDATLLLDVSPKLKNIKGCSPEIHTTLATHAVRPSNYGPPRLWTEEDVDTIGVAFAGLKPEAIGTISPEAMAGLGSGAMKAISPGSLQSFSTEQISFMSYSAAAAVSLDQIKLLSPEQKKALESVLTLPVDAFLVQVDGEDQLVGKSGTLPIPPPTEAHDFQTRSVGNDTQSINATTMPENVTTSTTTPTPSPKLNPTEDGKDPDSDKEVASSTSVEIGSSILVFLSFSFVINRRVL